MTLDSRLGPGVCAEEGGDMFCQKCGSQMRDEAEFCPQCGARVSGVSPVAPSQPQPPQPQPSQQAQPPLQPQAPSAPQTTPAPTPSPGPPSGRWSRNNLIIIGLAVVLVALAIVLAVVLLTGNGKGSPEKVGLKAAPIAPPTAIPSPTAEATSLDATSTATFTNTTDSSLQLQIGPGDTVTYIDSSGDAWELSGWQESGQYVVHNLTPDELTQLDPSYANATEAYIALTFDDAAQQLHDVCSIVVNGQNYGWENTWAPQAGASPTPY